MDSAVAPPGSYLRYGDFIIIEVDGIEGCEKGGILGSEDVKHSSERFAAINRQQLLSSKCTPMQAEATFNKDDEDSSIIEPRYLGVSAVQEVNGLHHPPRHFFQQNIFQVAHGVGFEAPGQSVHYGTQIRLRLVSTGEYLHVNRQADMLELIPDAVQSKLHLKECNFKISPRYQVRNDGDYVYYKDLVTLSDVVGRQVFCTSSSSILMSVNANQKSGLRLTSYLAHDIALRSIINGGSTLQLYHKDESCFVVANHRHGPSGDATMVEAKPTDTTLLESSTSYWQIETLIAGQYDLRLHGQIYHGTACRLRHVLTSKYLAVKANQVVMVADTEGETEFEFLLNIDDSVGTTQDLLMSTHLPIGVKARLRNRLSGQYIVITKDSKEVQLFVSSSRHEYDKDVFTLFAIPRLFMETVVQVQKYKHGFERMIKRMQAVNLPKIELSLLVERAIEHLEVLLRGENILGQLISSAKSADAKIGLDICNELHFGATLLQLADCALKVVNRQQQRGGICYNESNLAKTAYAVLGKMLERNVGAVYSLLRTGGVSIMVQHLMQLGATSDWTPPLLEMVDTLYEDDRMAQKEHVNILSPADVELLLDSVYERLLAREVPDEYPYRLLARICKPGTGLISSGNQSEYVNKNMQLLVCQYVLGSPFAGRSKSPFWSMMTYRTALGSPKPCRQPDVLISTSICGQFRPTGMSGNEYVIPRPDSVGNSDCSEANWKRCVAIRNAALPPNERHAVVRIADPSVELAAELDRLSPFMDAMQQNVTWRELTDLNVQEIGFYCATLQLLAALSAGRNIWTQRLVRQLLPLDHVLLVLDTVSGDSIDDQLMEIKTMMLSVLYYCYIDSANIPVVPNSSRSSLFTEQLRQESMETSSWDEIFMQECYWKLFAMCSQDDNFLIDVTKQMQADDMMTCLNSLLYDEQTRHKNNNPHWSTSSEYKVLMKDINQVVADSNNQGVDIAFLRELLMKLHLSKKVNHAANSVHCLEQRALLMRIVSKFIDSDAMRLWLISVQNPLLEFAGPKNHPVFERNAMTSSKRNFTSNSDVPRNIRKIRHTMNFMENMFAVVQSLMLRRFFDPCYNAYPMVRSGADCKAFYAGFDQSLYELVFFVGYDGEKVQYLQCRDLEEAKGRPVKRTLNKPADSKLYLVKDVYDCSLSIISTWPGEQIDPRFRLDEDEKLMDDYFRRQFGYITDNYGLVEGTLRVKLLCCRILSVSLDLLHSTTIAEVHKIFSPLFQTVIHAKVSASDREIEALSAKDASLNRMTSTVERFRQSLTSDEARAFRLKAWSGLHEKLERNPDMLWNTTVLFREQTLQTLLRIALDNNPELRGEVMNLIFRLNSHRAELSEFMMSEYQSAGSEDPTVGCFLERRKFYLTQILSRFDTQGGNMSMMDMEDESRDRVMEGYLLKLRLLLLNPPHSDNVGLINFCFLDHFDTLVSNLPADAPADRAAVRSVENHRRELTPIKGAPQEDDLLSPERVTAMGSTLLAHSISAYTPPDKIFHGMPNARHQKLLDDAGFDTVIVDFIVNNSEYLETMSQQAMPSSNLADLFSTEAAVQSKHESNLFQVFKLCCVFLKVIILKNKRIVKNVATRKLMSAMMSLRYVFPEALPFISDVLKIEPAVVENISTNEFVMLVKDVQKVIRAPDGLNRNGGKDMTASKCAEVVGLIEQIILSEIRVSPQRLSIFISALYEEEDGSNDLFFNRVLNLGLGLQLDGGPYDPRRFDVKYTCTMYRLDTGRTTYSRFPKDILKDQPMPLETYKKMRTALMSWQLLSDKSTFKVHLALIFLVGTCAHYSMSLQALCKKLFPTSAVVLQVLMIDKVEVRMPYLRLLHGLWLSEKQDTNIRTVEELLNTDCKIYILALLASIVRDCRLYLYYLQDQEIATIEHDCHLRGVPHELGMLPSQMKVIQNYLRQAVLPFISGLIKFNLHHAFDELQPGFTATSVKMPSSPIPTGVLPTCQTLISTLQELLGDIYVSKPTALVMDEDDAVYLSQIFSSLSTGDNNQQAPPSVVFLANKLLKRDKNFVLPVITKKSSVLSRASLASATNEIELLKHSCLEEFIPEVDRFAQKIGYMDVDYILRTHAPELVYIGDREYSIPLQMSFDPATIAGAVPGTKYDIISNPLNCEAFRFLQSKITKMVLSYAHSMFETRFRMLKKELKHLVNRPPTEFESIIKFVPQTEDERLKDAYGRVRLSHALHEIPSGPGVQLSKNQKNKLRQHEAIVDQFSRFHFLRWTKGGGMLIDLFKDHHLFSLRCLQTHEPPRNVSYTLDDLCKCNDYWTSLITKGVLRSRMEDIFELYSDRTELQLALLAIEQKRLRLFQEVFEEVGAVGVVIKLLSITPAAMKKSVSYASIRLVHRAAVNFGSTLNELGNVKIQDAMIRHAKEEHQLSISLGRGNGFFEVIRGMLHYYSRSFQRRSGVNRNLTADAVKLMRLLSHMCEGHHKLAQEYLGEHRIVGEVANFIADLNKLLAAEMNLAMISVDDFPLKHRPKILGKTRSLIQWINPTPSFDTAHKLPTDLNSTSTKNANPGNVKHKMIHIERMAYLCEVITAGLEALSEFCQGPRPEIQLIIARAASTRDFKTFFEFFGAFHLHGKFKDVTYKPDHQKLAFRQLYNTSVKAIVTHQAVIDINTELVHWYGNDPLAVGLILRFADEQTSTETESNGVFDINKGFVKLQHMLINNTMTDLVGDMLETGSVDSLDVAGLHSETAQFNCIDFWSVEKETVIEYRRRRDKITETLELNWYERISEFEKTLVKLESSCVKLAMSLLESSAQDDLLEIPKIVVNNIGTDNLVCNMANFWTRYLSFKPSISESTAESCFERSMAYSYYSLIMRIQDLNFEDNLRSMMDDWKGSVSAHVEEHIARIEVRTHDPNTLAVVYFPVPPIVKHYWNRGDVKELRDNIVFPSNVGTRDSAEEKVKNFLKDARMLISTLRHLESLDEIYAPKSIFLHFIVGIAHNINRWSQLACLTTLLLNILLVISVKVHEHEVHYYVIEGPMYVRIIPPIGIAQLVLVSLCCFSYVIMSGWLYIKQGLRENPHNEFTFRGYVTSRIAFALNSSQLLGIKPAELVNNTVTIKVNTTTAAVKYFLDQSDTAYFLSMLAFSLAGNLVSPLFFACCLMQVLRMSKLMQYVMRAFTANIDQVAATLVLAVIFMYLFVVVAMSDRKIHNQYYLDAVGEGGCYSLESCFRMHLDYGMLASVFWKFPTEIPSAQGELFNFGLTFIMQIVIPGLISGIIIDTFSEMRGNKQMIEEDVINTCFVCNIDREDFETSSVSFDEHIQNDHNMWKYVWFMIHLDEKDKTEFDGIENFCFDIIQLRDGSTRWLPLKMARALSQMRDKYDLFTIYNKINSLQSNLEKMQSEIKTDASGQTKEIRDAFKNDSQNLEKSLLKVLRKLEKKVAGSGNSRTPGALGGAAAVGSPRL